MRQAYEVLAVKPHFPFKLQLGLLGPGVQDGPTDKEGKGEQEERTSGTRLAAHPQPDAADAPEPAFVGEAGFEPT